MNFDKIAVLISGIISSIFIYWFFFMKKENSIEANERVQVVVSGGYNPETIKVKKGQKIVIEFLRKDPSSCLEEVVLSDFKIRKFLPLNKKTEIVIIPQEEGVFNFSCGMNMYHGKLIVE